MDKLYIPVFDNRKLNLEGLRELVKPYKKVLVTSTIQFKERIREVGNYLEGHDIIFHSPVLGCVNSLPDADCVVVITTGDFHPLRVALVSRRPVFVVGPSGARRFDDKKAREFLRKQAIRISRVLDAEIIGVILSTKSGQKNEALAREALSALRGKGKKAFLFVANEISPAQLNDFPVDAWVNTACPRIVEDKFEKPMVNWLELKEYI